MLDSPLKPLSNNNIEDKVDFLVQKMFNFNNFSIVSEIRNA